MPELARIEALLAAARAGHGGSLVVRGEAGIGKTALLAVARERAIDLRVLSACGVETESQLPFAALIQVLEPVVDLRDRLPAPQASALASALTLGPPAQGDRLAVCVATLGLLRAAAEAAPVLVLIDDAHWLDAASAECLSFAARRLGGTPIAMLLAVRDAEPSPVGFDELPSLRTPPLDLADACTLVHATAPDLIATVRDAVVALAAGNPLALIEVTSQLSADERAGRTSLPEPLHPAGRLAGVFERRLGTLPADARSAVLVAATLGSGDVATIWRACDALGVDRTALEHAESAGLVRLVAGQLTFAHPLLRSTAYHVAPEPRRRDVHRAVAAVVEGARRAWHLAAAAAGPDEDAAYALQEAGAAAAARRGYAEAAAAYERAAALSPELERRARRLMRACNAHIVAGAMERALALLDEVVGLDTPAARDPRVLHTRAILLIGTAQFTAGFAMVKNLAEMAVALADPVTAAFVLADAAMSALIVGDCRDALALAERAMPLLADAGSVRERAHVLAAWNGARVFRGEARAARAAMDEVTALVAQLDPLDWSVGVRTHALAIHLSNALEDYERARRIAGDVMAVLDDAGALGARSNPLSHAADAAHRMGDWDVAWRENAEAMALSEECRTDETLVRCLVMRARLAAARGLEQDARDLADRALAIADRCGIGSIPPYAHAAVGLLELGLGRIDAAIARLAPLEDAMAAVHGLLHPTIVPWRADLCEAYVMAGRMEDARRQAVALTAEAESAGGAAGQAMAARCRGWLDEDFATQFDAALSLDDARPMPFERARTLLAYGVRLHRARRRGEARRVLREAEEIFARLGATPWSERVAVELAAAGASRGPRRARSADVLTSQEVRVARVIARGHTIREAAAELFLSPKTIDFHLQQIYGKLAIRSRAELAAVAVDRGWIRVGDAGGPGPSSARPSGRG